MKRYLIGLIILAGCGRVTYIPGPQGIQGPAGPKGDKGNDGTSCSVSQDTHGVTIYCTDGTNAQVLDGSPCTTSAVNNGVQVSCPDGSTQVIYNGVNGSNGTNGLPGTVVTPIQLCSQYNTTYPSSFPEFGFCIDSKLFAVYWDGTHAFEAEVVPGNYVSTSPQTCSFTVAANCVVTQ